MSQHELFPSDTPRTLARRTDPEPSHEAASWAVTSGTVNRLQQHAIVLVQAFPGRTATELAQASEWCNGDPRIVNRRLSEVEKRGKVRRGEPRTCSVTGRKAATWWPA